MAIAFAHVSVHTRSKGHSAVAASSYRTSTKLFDARTGITHDYSNRKDVVFSTILLPEGSAPEFEDREFLWNQVELAEKRRDAQVCKDIVLALPKELDLIQQIELTKRFAQTHFVENGLPADIAIHDHGDGNPHAHILITTRRLENNRFSKYKARDLNPVFANKFIVEKEYWGEQWRDFQNEFFNDHQLDLSVDFNHVINEKHTGQLRDDTNSYLHEENQLIKAVRIELALLNPEALINQISLTHSVFTRRDIERLVFKTFDKIDNAAHYLHVVAEILENKNIVKLGANDRGNEAYTTRQHYIQEGKLLHDVEQLHSRKNHVVSQSLDGLITQYSLNEEQADAVHFIANGEDISVLIGRPGVGKSYLLKPLKEHYESNGGVVLGASLSGKVAKALQADTGITSSTIASLTYRLSTQKLTFTKDHVLIIDEAGMVDFANMAYLLEAVNKAGAKIILVGDPDQLKPIHKGEIFRGIAARTGYIELDNIKRQRDEGDRGASLALARGQIDVAIQHYSTKGAIKFSDGHDEAATALVDAWQKDLNAESIKKHMMLAFSRAAVATLNAKGREAMQAKGLVQHDGFEYFSENGAREVMLSEGERILLRQNDKGLGVRNGDLATITAINATAFTALLDSGEQITIPKTYQFIEHGYALTVHKSQGMTVDNASILIDSTYWDRHLAFVAMTRHREKLNIYANTTIHLDLESLTRTLSRTSTKDNVIDWPLDFAMRAGFESDSLIGRAIKCISKTTDTIKDKWNYVVNYEAYLNAQDIKTKFAERHALRSVAQQVAGLMDEASDWGKQFKQLEKEAALKKVKQSELPQFDALYKRSLMRDEQAAHLLITQREALEKMTQMPKAIESIKGYGERHERYKIIIAIAKLSETDSPHIELAKQATTIDLKKDHPHIVRLAVQHHKTPDGLRKQIETLQQQYKKQVLAQLCKAHPILAGYEQLTQQRAHVSGYKGEQLDKSIQVAAKAITDNQPLMNILKQDLPQMAIKVQKQVQHQHERDRGL